MAERVHADTEEGKEEARAILTEIWDMPAEYEALGLLEGAYWGGAGDNQRGAEKAFLGNTRAIGYQVVSPSFVH